LSTTATATYGLDGPVDADLDHKQHEEDQV
jgi:hypothetical protein